MVILTKELLKDTDKFVDIIEKEKELVNISIKSQKNIKNSLLESMQKLANSTVSVETNVADTIVKLLESYKNSLELSKTNLSLLNNMLNRLDNILKLDNENPEKEITNFNTKTYETNKTILNNTLQIEETLNFTLSLSDFTFFYDKSFTSQETTTNMPSVDASSSEKELTADIPASKELIKDVDNTDKLENTLIISEQKRKVFLPYSLSTLDDLLENNSDKYSSIDDIIEKEYTLPFELFKNPAFSRFREAFKLMRIKEKKSLKDSFDLGMELLFNYNLHPAIISACKNLDELDIYLDYLENGETQKFSCFNIVFDVAPIVIKSKRSQGF